MAGRTTNYDFPLLDPSQSQPEVPINEMMELADAAIAAAVSSITVKQVGNSPSGDAFNVRELHFIGATVEEQSNGVALVTVDPASGGTGGPIPVVLQLACSDLVTALTTGTSIAYCRAPSAFTLTEVRSSVLVSSSSGLPTVNVKKNGTTVFSTNLSIDSGENTSVTAATPAVISTSAIADDDLLTIDITVSGTGTKGLIVTLIGHI